MTAHLTKDDLDDIARQISAALNKRDPYAGRDPRSQQWEAEDGWLVGYTTERMGDGKFSAYAYKPRGKGSRSGRGRAGSWEKVYERHFSTRKAAKARAVALFRQHSPKWAARHPEVKQ